VVRLNNEVLAGDGANQEAEARWLAGARMGRSRRGVAGEAFDNGGGKTL
jgi:hypothetical protein